MTLIQALLRHPKRFPNPVRGLKLIETHISWVILTGEYAYKIKKPLNLGFLDFSTLEKRHYFIEQELVLNQALTSSLYQSVLPIYGSETDPSFTPDGKPPIEYALQMREFSQRDLLTHWIKRVPHSTRNLAFETFIQQLADFHKTAPLLPENSPYGQMPELQKAVYENFQVIETRSHHSEILGLCAELRRWTESTLANLMPLLTSRKIAGFTRQLHGDLHLGNLVWFDDQVQAFDRIEFNPDFQWIDTMNDLGFLLMDLEYRGYWHLAYRCLNLYLDITADYESLKLLRFYKIYRALVLAKVAILSPHAHDHTRDHAVLSYLHYADNLRKKPNPLSPGIMLMHGFSGSGKSILATTVGTRLPALILRTDVYRQIHVLGQNTATSTLYSPENRFKVYVALLSYVKDLVQEGYPVVIDGSFLKAEHRQAFSDVAQQMNCPWVIIDLQVKLQTLQARLESPDQSTQKRFGSQANFQVLEEQQREAEALSPIEHAHLIRIRPKTSLRSVLKRLFSRFESN